jgi:hypothetical protein
MAKQQQKRLDTPLAPTPSPVKLNYEGFSMAREYTNLANGRSANTPATKKDSLDFRSGFKKGVNNKKFTAEEEPFGENEYQKFGRYAGQKAVKKAKK